MKIFNWIKKRLSKGSATWRIVFTSDGFQVFCGEELINQVVWSSVKQIFTYKHDLFTTDAICLSFISADSMCTIDELIEGFSNVCDILPTKYPGLLDGWYEKVVKPPFARNHICIWDSRLQEVKLSDIYSIKHYTEDDKMEIHFALWRENRLLWKRSDKLHVFSSPSIILMLEHNLLIAGYAGQIKAFNLTTGDFMWYRKPNEIDSWSLFNYDKDTFIAHFETAVLRFDFNGNTLWSQTASDIITHVDITGDIAEIWCFVDGAKSRLEGKVDLKNGKYIHQE